MSVSTDTSPPPDNSGDAVSFNNASAVVTDTSITVAGQCYPQDQWNVTVVLTPIAFTPGYFRLADLPVDQHTGPAEYKTVQPVDPADGSGTWVRCNVVDQ